MGRALDNAMLNVGMKDAARGRSSPCWAVKGEVNADFVEKRG